jgi:hypothetical protein
MFPTYNQVAALHRVMVLLVIATAEFEFDEAFPIACPAPIIEAPSLTVRKGWSLCYDFKAKLIGNRGEQRDHLSLIRWRKSKSTKT